ncbi:hypothetical protein GCM10007981_08550 [Thermocladium modestius]|uniref:Uncharacterized protein n=1 Tax=Thermocladium modestius TaxID=62609 RepID=A0A830GW36_9CREN|nr:hypothetical protein [Thermocladium modestius]GGP20445.1 hypothetical protein GCM10007981_08550 [Thermocladium modestius]
MIPYLNWSIIYASISLQAGYGLIKMNMGSLQQRREGEEHLYNTIYGVVLLVVFYVIYAKLGTICGAIAASLGIRSISDPVIIFNSLFTSISSTLEGLYLSIIALDAAIVTSPLGVYLSQSTQYFQWMAQLALSNAWLFYVLSRIGEYSPELAGLGFNLVILRQTRTWGGILLAIAITLPISTTLLASWASYISINISFANVARDIEQILTGAYSYGSQLQEFNIASELTLAISGASIYGISKAIDDVGHQLL